MDPMMLLQLGGLGAGGLMSLLGGRKEPSMGSLESMFGTGAVGNRAQQLYSILASSPAFRSMLGSTNLQGQGVGNAINANLAKAGLNTTGVGAIGGALGDATSGFARGSLIGGLHEKALSSATDLNSLLANLFLNTRQKGATPWQNLGGSLLGASAHGLLGRRPAGGNNTAPTWTNEGSPSENWG